MNYPLLQKTPIISSDKKIQDKFLKGKAIALTVREQDIIQKWFPYQYNPIVGYPSDSGKPRWVTWKKIDDETKLKIFANPQMLVGVGFDQMTRYTVLDIDRPSPNHPANNKAEFDRFLEALESFGITGYQILQSSDSGVFCISPRKGIFQKKKAQYQSAA